MENKSSDIFLYLLGAGASCKALPLASQFANKLNVFVSRLTTYAKATCMDESGHMGHREEIFPLWRSPCRNFCEAVKWLAREASHHASIDTFAKKLYFKKDEENLRKLKIVLSAYLIAEQSTNNVDLRYDSFFASICKFDDNNAVCLPPNLRILTWNYDAQLEKAFYGFCEDDNLLLNNITMNHHQIRRINGCCGHEKPGNISEYFDAVWKTSPESHQSGYEAGIKFYNKYMQEDCSFTPDICFAWEEEQRRNLLHEDLHEVSVLVVIGYSFPYFNRDMDEQIFKRFGNKLQKVYLQSPAETYDAVERRLHRLLPYQFSDKTGHRDIIKITSTDLFFIPDEF